MLGEKHADDFYSTWEWVTNRMGSEEMTPYLVDHLNYEHPTLRQQMVAMMASLLNMMDAEHGCDARCDASCLFLGHLQAWLRDYQQAGVSTQSYIRWQRLYISPKGEIKFPFI